ncbi:hypothetical protein GWK47_045969 [Chionoecetes opilio]|uniref:Uncharacterized protein n=1 Tax=Chionoecetes opilio TaxID=41210 RepID=A0A8J4YEB8_CHIOP|nr:hypothetical protein GWK47_045969 [Chionoecetes opilio]
MFNLFDVAHADALKLNKNPEDRDFLLAQWELGQRGSVGSVELVLVRKEEAAQKKEANARQIEKTRMEQEASCSQVELASSFLVSSDYEGLTAALYRTKMSNRRAPYVLTEVAKSLGHDPVELNMSRPYVKCYRERYRAEKWADLKEGFKETGEPCVVIWDGKLLPSLLDSGESVDRLPVLVTFITSGETQLLGVPKLDSGTGNKQANAVYALLQEWDLEDKQARGPPPDQTFKCSAVFKGNGTFFDKKEFRTGWDTDETRLFHRGGNGGSSGFRLFRTATKSFKDDYREFLELVIIYLGGSVPGFSFKHSGAMHQARWMAKILTS